MLLMLLSLQKTIEEALCIQFGVKSVTELGFGNIEKLISKKNKVKQNEFVSEKERRLFYEAALLVRLVGRDGL